MFLDFFQLFDSKLIRIGVEKAIAPLGHLKLQFNQAMSRGSYLHSDPKFRIPFRNFWGKLRLFLQSALSIRFIFSKYLQNLSLEKLCLAIRSINFEIIAKISMLADAYIDEYIQKLMKSKYYA